MIAGMFISTMFAGHHTTSGAAAWTLIELLRNPSVMQAVHEELDQLYAEERDVSYQALREMPELEAALKESLRLHPPLIILMRKVMEPFQYKDYRIEVGTTVAVSPAISNRMGEYFDRPQSFDVERYKSEPRADRQAFTWLPFGAGRHRCVGAAFALLQLKAIFSVLFENFEFALSQPSDTYRNDHSKMVVQLMQPCKVKYRRRTPVVASTPGTASGRETAKTGRGCIKVDLDLCQGHGVCVSEAPEAFDLDKKELKVRLLASEVDGPLREKVERAVENCPTGAIKLIDG
jgi:sterol 14-demethylase